MVPDLPPPQPALIDRISPSAANNLFACKLRIGFSRDEAHSGWRRPVPASVLGTTSHHVIELAFRSGAAPTSERDAMLSVEWERKIAEAVQQLATAWAPAEPPPPQEWPGYQLTRVRTLRRASRIAASRTRHSGLAEGATEASGLEAWLEAPEWNLYGRVDRVDRVDGRLRVVDVKAGIRVGEPTPEHVLQLLLYAALVQKTRGEWPSEIAIESASGQQHVIGLDPQAALDAVASVRAAVDEFNDLARSGVLEASARPTRDLCRFCPFRIVCRPYWLELVVEWNHRALMGEVLEVNQSNDRQLATVRLVSPSDASPPTVQVSGLPAATVPPTAQWLGAIDLEPVNGRPDWSASWASIVRGW